ncbi:MAG TPA: hypothetical protein PLE74_00885 [Candidatus Cloacimonadota bacterium]|nr:hypothetical protein [Candidatus Cloacimonadota bacterium]
MKSGHLYHDDVQGILGTALSGTTQWTLRELRTTGVVIPHIARNDIFSMIFQMTHRKKLQTPCDSVHIHYVPIASANGNIVFDFTWGWFNHGDVIPATLPNSGSKTITLATTDQYKMKLDTLIADMAAPSSEVYSSILMVKIQRVTTGDTWGTGEIALAYLDAHVDVDRFGSYNEATD